MVARTFLACSVCLLGCSAPSMAPDGVLPASGGGTGGLASASAGGAPAGVGGGFLMSPNGGNASACAKDSYVSDLVPSNILFVVDRSGSMNCNLNVPSAECEASPETDDPNAPTKWSVITGTMSSALAALTGAPNISVGLSLFSNNDECGVRATPSVGIKPLTEAQRDAMTASLSGVEPRGGTPFVGATVLAYKHLHEEAQSPGNRFVVIVTDGADSCLDRYDEQGDLLGRLLDTEIPKARTVNIRTFVIGAPGSEGARGLLSQMAWAGGTARSAECDHTGNNDAGDCHFDMTRTQDFTADLTAALEQISGRAALACVFGLPESEGVAVDREKVNVDYFRAGVEKVELLRDDRPCDAGANGWQYIDGDQTRVQVCGPLCDEIRGDPDGRVDIELGCETRVAR